MKVYTKLELTLDIFKKKGSVNIDNKRIYKRITTFIWLILTALPLILALIYFIGYHLTFNSGITSNSVLTDYHINGYNAYSLCLSNFTLFDYMPSWLVNPLTSLMNTLSITNTNIQNVFIWAIMVNALHLAYDLIVWVFNLVHSLLEGVHIKC